MRFRRLGRDARPRSRRSRHAPACRVSSAIACGVSTLRAQIAAAGSCLTPCSVVPSVVDMSRRELGFGSGPCVDGFWLSTTSITFRRLSLSSHVFGLFLRRLAAGPYALRGSGPGQERAFENALARMGCPDHRVAGLHNVLFALSNPPVSASRSPPGSPARQLGRANATGSL